MVVPVFDPQPEFPVDVAYQPQVMQSDPRNGVLWTRAWGNAAPARTFGLNWDNADIATIDRIRFLWEDRRGSGEMTWYPIEELRVTLPSLPTAIRVKFWEMPSLPASHGAITGRVRVTLTEVVPGG